MRSRPSWTSCPQVKRVSKQCKGRKSGHASEGIKASIKLLRERMPRFVVIDMSVVLVVSPVADPPAMIRHENGRMCEMPDEIIKPFVPGKAPMPTVVPEDEESPKHSPLREPVEGPEQPVVEVGSSGGECSDDDNIAEDKTERSPGIFDPAVFGNGGTDFSEGEGRRGGGIERRKGGVGGGGGRRGRRRSRGGDRDGGNGREAAGGGESATGREAERGTAGSEGGGRAA